MYGACLTFQVMPLAMNQRIAQESDCIITLNDTLVFRLETFASKNEMKQLCFVYAHIVTALINKRLPSKQLHIKFIFVTNCIALSTNNIIF